jgi:hypothetical protein
VRATRISEFLNDASNIQTPRDILAVHQALKERFPTRKWPVAEGSERRLFQELVVVLDMMSGGKATDLLEKYILSGGRQGGSERMVQRSEMHKQILQLRQTENVVKRNIKKVLDDCNAWYTSGEKKHPVVNAV